MSCPRPSSIRVLGVRTDEPSISGSPPVKMIHPRGRLADDLAEAERAIPSVKSSASDSEDSLVTSTVGLSARWPSAWRPGSGNRSRGVIVR